MGGWFGMSRREENHLKNENVLLRGKAREAQRQAIAKQRAEQKAKDAAKAKGRERNNRREY